MIDLIANYWRFLLFGEFPSGPLGGLALTIVLSVISLVLTFPIAVTVALARTAQRKIIVWPATVYVYLVRGLPLLTFMLWIYFLLPLLTPRPVPPMWTLILAIVIYQSAYLSEIIRAGIEALPPGQLEAAKSLGMPYGVTTFKVILPQALYNVIPGIVNQFTVIVKESSLGSIIALSELTFVAQRVNAYLLTESLNVFALLAAIYFVICYMLSLAVKGLERRIERGRRSVQTELPYSATTAEAIS